MRIICTSSSSIASFSATQTDMYQSDKLHDAHVMWSELYLFLWFSKKDEQEKAARTFSNVRMSMNKRKQIFCLYLCEKSFNNIHNPRECVIQKPIWVVFFVCVLRGQPKSFNANVWFYTNVDRWPTTGHIYFRRNQNVMMQFSFMENIFIWWFKMSLMMIRPIFFWSRVDERIISSYSNWWREYIRRWTQ